MNKYLVIALLWLGWGNQLQATFSMVAVDPVTREVGSAAVSCFSDDMAPGSNGVSIAGVLYPDKGAINTQAYWVPQNQINAGDQLLSGSSPQEVVDWLALNDVEGFPQFRQYAVIDFFEDSIRKAQYSGTLIPQDYDWIIGDNYIIIGNFLIGDSIVDLMEQGFLNTEGSLAEKLMGALQGANQAGADVRCLGDGVPGLSAYVRVAKPDDEVGDYFLDLIVPSIDAGENPIDLLQDLLDQFILDNSPLSSIDQDDFVENLLVSTALGSGIVQISASARTDLRIQLLGLNGIIYKDQELNAGDINLRWTLPELAAGIYVISIRNASGLVYRRKVLIQ